MRVKFNEISEVNEFALISNKFSSLDIDLKYGRYTVDAKSILGILSFGLGKELCLSITDNNCDFDSEYGLEVDAFKQRIEGYLVG